MLAAGERIFNQKSGFPVGRMVHVPFLGPPYAGRHTHGITAARAAPHGRGAFIVPVPPSSGQPFRRPSTALAAIWPPLAPPLDGIMPAVAPRQAASGKLPGPPPAAWRGATRTCDPSQPEEQRNVPASPARR